MKYWYCSVKVKNSGAVYSYINDEGELPAGTYVQVPFGKNNAACYGEVVVCRRYDEEAAPFPAEKTKHITRVVTEEEYAGGETAAPFQEEDDIADIDEVEQYIEAEDWDEVLYWAIDHQYIRSEEIIEKVIQCYRLCAEQNMPVAALNLGAFYYNGVHLTQDFEEAFRLYKIAADAGELRAICNCGYCFYYGRHQAVDYAEAFHYFSLGALLFGDPNCLYKLGDMYLEGKAVERNRKYAYMLYDRALRRCDDSDTDDFCQADIQLRVGKCRLRGIGTGKNVESSHTMLSLALDGFYRRRKDDPFVGGLIKETRALLDECELILDRECLS